MAEIKKYQGSYVFGLDIGTRSIVGTAGYKAGDRFIVVAQQVKEHETRAMIDGQIHDIAQVGATVAEVKKALEQKIDRKLTDVCIAAAGRVLRTVTTHVDYELGGEKEVTAEDIYTLDSMGVEKAFEEFQKSNDTDVKFYCVGYSVVKYYMNHYPMNHLESHKAKAISADMIATFLPDDVVDGLYKAVELAGLQVANLTLEPIAAIQVAIPEMYRMLNIALVDVGAGTSDISITKDGSIIAYGMIPLAGDRITEVIAQHCLVDFATAEQIKRAAVNENLIEYKDIMGLKQTIKREEVLEQTKSVVANMTKQVSDKIKELNGEKSVSAVFVVGGGGKIPGYTEALAAELEIAEERVALRGEEVMEKIDFMDKSIKKDSLLVTPIGICLNFYEQSNNFIFVSLNGERLKLYDNNKLAIVDAVMQADFPNDALFPKRGTPLNFVVNGKSKMVRGELGEAAVISLNGEIADMNAPVHANDIIVVEVSTAGEPAKMEIGQLQEYNAVITIIVNEKVVELPRFASVNGNLQSAYYGIKEKDTVEMMNYYTVQQIAEFMDVIIDRSMNIYVNNKLAGLDTKVYENFSVIWTMETLSLSDVDKYEDETMEESEKYGDSQREEVETGQSEASKRSIIESGRVDEQQAVEQGKDNQRSVPVVVNGRPITLKGKPQYIFVDVFDYIDFDLSKPQGKVIVTNLNGSQAQYMESVQNGDVIEIYWKD